LWDDNFENVMERYFPAARLRDEEMAGSLTPRMDVVERDGEFVVRTDLPGIKKEDISITLESGVLTISGETKEETEEKEGGQVIRQERCYGKYMRSLRLATPIDEKRVKANYKDGVLELVLPKAEEAKPKKITVDVG
jgi:HSP20 family protein